MPKPCHTLEQKKAKLAVLEAELIVSRSKWDKDRILKDMNRVRVQTFYIKNHKES